MAFKEGEVYRCPDPDCGCEIKVTKGAAPGKGAIKSRVAVAEKKMEKIEQ